MKRYTVYYVPFDTSIPMDVRDASEVSFEDLNREEIYQESVATNPDGITTVVSCFAFYDASSEVKNARASFFKYEVYGNAFLVWLECRVTSEGDLVDTADIFRSFVPKDFEELNSKILKRTRIGLFYLYKNNEDIYHLDQQKYENPFPDEYDANWKGLSPKSLVKMFTDSIQGRFATITYSNRFPHAIYDEKKRLVHCVKLVVSFEIDDGNVETFEFYSPKQYTKKIHSEQNAALEYLKSLHANQIGIVDEIIETSPEEAFPPMDPMLKDFDYKKYKVFEKDYDVQDILGDGKIKKITLKKGTGKYVPFSCKCRLHYVMAVAEDKEDTLQPKQKEAEINIWEPEFHCFQYMLRSMKKGEVAIFYVHYDFVFGNVISDTIGSRPFVFGVHIPDHIDTIIFENHRIGYKDNFEEKMDIAQKYKEQGNDYYNRELFKLAFDSYFMAHLSLRVKTKYDRNNRKIEVVYPDRYGQLKSLIQLNIAAACLQMDSWIESNDPSDFGLYHCALSHLNEVIDFNPVCVKAYLRRARVYAILGDIDKAKSDADKAKGLDPNVALNSVRKEIQNMEIKSKQRQIKIAKKL